VDPASARQAARALGKRLAAEGCRLVVYSADFIETEVVAGFVSVPGVAEHSIQLRYPADQERQATAFTEVKTHPRLFEKHPDSSRTWDPSFYKSLGDVDGIVLVGGRKTVLITGMVALSFRKPLLALRAFGGAASTVWDSMRSPAALASTNDLNEMDAGAPWPADEAGQKAILDGWWEALRKQIARGKRDRFRRTRDYRVAISLVLLLAFAGLLAFHFTLALTESRSLAKFFPALLVATPLLAGGAGSMLRSLYSGSPGDQPGKTIVLGLGAGFITGLVYFVGQVTGGTQLPDPGSVPTVGLVFGLVTLASLMSFVAGFTLDQVLARLAKENVLDTRSLQGADRASGAPLE
jgi:hypothetical protein